MKTNLEKIRHSLPFKVAGLVVGILVLGFGGLMVLNIQRESNSLVAKYEDTARLLATAITIIPAFKMACSKAGRIS